MPHQKKPSSFSLSSTRSLSYAEVVKIDQAKGKSQVNNLSVFKRLSDTKGDFLVHSTKASTEVLNFNQSKGKSQVNKPSVFKRMFYSNGDSYIRPPKASSLGTKILPEPVLPCSSPTFLNQMLVSMPTITASFGLPFKFGLKFGVIWGFQLLPLFGRWSSVC
jgi:hypothetical protein